MCIYSVIIIYVSEVLHVLGILCVFLCCLQCSESLKEGLTHVSIDVYSPFCNTAIQFLILGLINVIMYSVICLPGQKPCEYVRICWIESIFIFSAGGIYLGNSLVTRLRNFSIVLMYLKWMNGYKVNNRWGLLEKCVFYFFIFFNSGQVL